MLVTACGNVAKNRRIPNWKESIKKENANEITEGIYLANDWVGGRKVILFIHGMGEQKSLGGILGKVGQTHNILGFKYSIYEDFEVNANKLRNDIVSISKECDLIVVAYSFGANILWQSVLNANDEEEQQALRSVDTRLVTPMFGSKYARGYTNDLIVKIYSALPLTPKVSNLINAVDPEGPIVKSLIKRYNEFVSRVRSAEMFIARGDSLNPNGEVVTILSLLKFYWTQDEIEGFKKFIEENNVRIISTVGFELQGDAHLDVWRTGEIYKSIVAADRPTIIESGKIKDRSVHNIKTGKPF